MGATASKGASASKDDASPARYLLKCESFSAPSVAKGINKYESCLFHSSGYKWKMIVYPDGDGSEDGRDHISVYLAIAETSTLPAGWEVNATFSFLLFDQIRDKFVVMKGTEGRFRNVKTEWGFSKCISHETFKEPSSGYLVNDKCVFAVDVYVIKTQQVCECTSSLNGVESYKHVWKISEFSKLKNYVKNYVENYVSSEEFIVGNHKWKLRLHPNGNIKQTGQSISIFLILVGSKRFDPGKRVIADFSFSVKNQITGALRTKNFGKQTFTATSQRMGLSAFLPLSEFKDPKRGYLVNDCCIVEAQVSVLSVFSS